jgi:hypothetical protein
LILIPGPGLNLRQLQFLTNSYIISRATGSRGRITEELEQTQVKKAGEQINGGKLGQLSLSNHALKR